MLQVSFARGTTPTSIKPALLETHHTGLDYNRNPPNPNEKKNPAINDPTVGSPMVTLLRLLLSLNDKVP